MILFALWVIVGEQITGVSSDAVVNARLSTVRAPIAGTLDMPMRPFGTVIQEGEALATLNDPLVDSVRRDDLRMELAFAAAEVERLVAFGADQVEANTSDSSADPEVLANRSPRTDTRIGQSDLNVYLSEARSRLAAIDARLFEENTRITRLSNANLTAPTDGLLWEVLADDNEVVQRGQDILKLMVCDSALVTLSVPDNVYNHLRVGQPAKFRLEGVETLYDGTITRIAGAGAETIYRNLAVAPSIKHLERYDIALLVPELRKNTELRCTVGQTGRVFFETRPLDWVRDLLK
ncbi:HlyD family efflux transporter periplasmic adaptor subunit [Falsihalocynthiibacter sp. CO-5D18]|uniref:HlyD family efflux transporter periplasmic adaptor subunit n=1 Tax=Falsihalocynthiibacter sp. CO-5D18 TaxID=3240872 RepID=UPI00350F472D